MTVVRTARSLLLLPLVLVAVLLPGSGHAADPVLKAKVGPGFSISMSDAAGVKVTRVPAGTYSIDVSDLSAEHNFHLFGPGGVDMATDVAGTGDVTWSVTLVDGNYTFHCDAHPGTMKGTLGRGACTAADPEADRPRRPGQGALAEDAPQARRSSPSLRAPTSSRSAIRRRRTTSTCSARA